MSDERIKTNHPIEEDDIHMETSDELAIILNRINQLEDTLIDRILSKSEQLERTFTTRFDVIEAALRRQSKEQQQEEEALKIRAIMIEYLRERLVRDGDDLHTASFNYQPIYKKGLIYIFLNDFKKYLAKYRAIDKEKPELVNFFNLLNVKHTVIRAVDPKTKKKTSRSAFVLPSTWVVLVENVEKSVEDEE